MERQTLPDFVHMYFGLIAFHNGCNLWLITDDSAKPLSTPILFDVVSIFYGLGPYVICTLCLIYSRVFIRHFVW